MEQNYFKRLYDVDVREKTKTKNGLNYVSWAAAWSEVKKAYPESTYTIYEQTIKTEQTTENGHITREINRPWFDDGNTGWVKTGVTIGGIEHIEQLPILDFKNKSIPASNITSSDANKSIQRSLTKACARHGLGLYVYEGEDLPEETRESEKLQNKCMELIKQRSALSDKTKDKVGEVCKSILVEENGDPRNCTDNEKLNELFTKLKAIRKIV